MKIWETICHNMNKDQIFCNDEQRERICYHKEAQTICFVNKGNLLSEQTGNLLSEQTGNLLSEHTQAVF
jgi:hypothetical protein